MLSGQSPYGQPPYYSYPGYPLASQTVPMHPFFHGQIPAFYHQPSQVNVPIAAHQLNGNLQTAVTLNDAQKPPNKLELPIAPVSDPKKSEKEVESETPGQ